MTGLRISAVRVVGYAILGGIFGGAPGFLAKETFLSPGWDGGLQHFGDGLLALLIGVAGGALGAVLGVLLARRQLRQPGPPADIPPILSLPAMGVLGAFLGAIMSGGLWGGLVIGGILLGIGLLAAQ